MPRKRTIEPSGRTVLLVDDNEEYLAASAMLITREGHEVITARGGDEALALLRRRRADLILVDYFMPGMTGEQFVRELRTFDPYVQVVLQTGYASERPPREMLRALDMQGYHDKSDGPEKLALWLDVGLKAASTTQQLNKGRQGLAYILGATPELHRIQSVEQLLERVLEQAAGLLGAVDAFAATTRRGQGDDGTSAAPAGFFATVQGGGEVQVRAGTGRFQGARFAAGSALPLDAPTLAAALERGEIRTGPGGTVIPLRVGDTSLGVIYLDRPVRHPADRELLAVFANQAAVAVQNMTFFELAAVDQLTRVYTRRFFEETLLRELRAAHRTGRPLSLVFADVDNLKAINDTAGHLAGDRALAAAGELLRACVRGSDVVGRYGGDEFVVLLPDTDVAGADAFARRAIARVAILRENGVRLGLTLGGAALGAYAGRARGDARAAQYFDAVAKQLIACADAGLYRGKRAGKGCATPVESLAWLPEEPASDSRRKLPAVVV